MIEWDDKRARADIKAYTENATKEVRDAVNTTAINIQAKAKRNIKNFGTITRPDGKKRTVLIDTGLMRASIHIGFRDDLSDLRTFADGANKSNANGIAGSRIAQVASGLKTAAAVTVGVKYAQYHELGRGVPKRAFLLPAAESERPDHLRRLKEAMKK